MGIFEIFGNGNKKEYERLHNRLDDLEEILHDISFRTDDRFESILLSIGTLLPEEKGKYVNRLEERLLQVKREMVQDTILSACACAPKTYPEVRKEVRDRTGLNITAAFLDDTIRHLSYAGKIERMGNRYFSAGCAAKADDAEIAKVLALPVRGEKQGGAGKLEKMEIILKAAAKLEKGNGAVPVPRLVQEASHEGIDVQTANQLIDEHLMVTGRLYEPSQGHVKLARPLP